MLAAMGRKSFTDPEYDCRNRRITHQASHESLRRPLRASQKASERDLVQVQTLLNDIIKKSSNAAATSRGDIEMSDGGSGADKKPDVLKELEGVLGKMRGLKRKVSLQSYCSREGSALIDHIMTSMREAIRPVCSPINTNIPHQSSHPTPPIASRNLFSVTSTTSYSIGYPRWVCDDKEPGWQLADVIRDLVKEEVG